jgi:hypothetical protein
MEDFKHLEIPRISEMAELRFRCADKFVVPGVVVVLHPREFVGHEG